MRAEFRIKTSTRASLVSVRGSEPSARARVSVERAPVHGVAIGGDERPESGSLVDDLGFLAAIRRDAHDRPVGAADPVDEAAAHGDVKGDESRLERQGRGCPARLGHGAHLVRIGRAYFEIAGQYT
jgi:hypothetical protein